MEIWEKLSADIFLSELILDGVISGLSVRYMAENTDITDIRELYFSKDLLFSLQGKKKSEKNFLSEVERERRKDYAKKMAEKMVDKGIFSVSFQDKEYPSDFSFFSGMPIILYGKGKYELVEKSKGGLICIVGTRRPSMYGLKVVKEAVEAFCRQDICIVSGLARGIDTMAHKTALSNKGNTIAVLAGGLDDVYPKENKGLFDRISVEGCVLSELPPGRRPLRQFFPARNRILSALSDLVLIAEAGAYSGTLHTASFAAAQGKDVFVTPGNIYAPQSVGCLSLLKDGAEMYTKPTDMIERLADIGFYREMDKIKVNKKKEDTPVSLMEKPVDKCDILIECIQIKDKSLDDLLEETGIPFQEMILLLAELEISRRILEVDGKYTYLY